MSGEIMTLNVINNNIKTADLRSLPLNCEEVAQVIYFKCQSV